MASYGFQVNVPSGFSNSDVLHLSEVEKSMAPSFGGEQRFRELKRDYLLGEEELRIRGRQLGEIAQRFLSELGDEYRLAAVNWNNNGTWTLEVGTPGGSQNVVLSWFLVDDVLSAGTPSELQRVRNMLFFGLRRQDLIFRKS
jgi:hypothetical protein